MPAWEPPASQPLPLRMDEYGAVRVGGTRVTLDTMATAFNEGSTPEEIMLQYPSLELADIYAVLAYYLRHRDEVEAYLDQRRREAEEVRRQIEAAYPRDGFRERLLARRALVPFPLPRPSKNST